MYEARGASLKDAEYIADNLREADCAELSLDKKDYKSVLIDGFKRSKDNHVGTYNDIPYFIGGVVPHEGHGLVWAVGTDQLRTHKEHLMAGVPEILDAWEDKYGILENLVWQGNPMHIRWLKHMGFTIGDTVKHNNTTYNYFHKGVPKCATPQQV
ncbi:MAG: phage protein Gp13 family protein [Nitrososphaerales archaeon]